MLGKRYRILSLELSELTTLAEIQGTTEGRKALTEVSIPAENISLMRTVNKPNCMLFQALELLKAEDEHQLRPKVGRAVIDTFEQDVVVVTFPRTYDKIPFIGQNNQLYTGQEMREHMYKKGFSIGGRKMLAAFAGAGMMREGKELFIAQDYCYRVLDKVTLGLLGEQEDQKTLKVNLQGDYKLVMSKFLSYVGLAGSSGQAIDELQEIYGLRYGKEALAQLKAWKDLQLSSDEIVVINDSMMTVDTRDLCPYVIENVAQKKQEGEKKASLKIQLTRKDEMELNLSDGCGLMAPELAEELRLMQKARKADYADHRAFIIRWPLIKGVLVDFDFQKYMEDCHPEVKTIRDAFGVERDVKKIKILLTRSMTKGLAYYANLPEIPQEEEKRERERLGWETYLKKLKESGLSLIVTGADSASDRQKMTMNIQTYSTISPDIATLDRLSANTCKRITGLQALIADIVAAGAEDEKELHRLAGTAMRVLRTSIGMEDEQGTNAAENVPEGEEEPKDEGTGEVSVPVLQPKDEGAGDQNRSIEEMVADLLEKYPLLVKSDLVMDTLNGQLQTLVTSLARCRIELPGSTRMLICDPFELLEHLVAKTNREEDPKVCCAVNRDGCYYAPGLPDAEEGKEAVLLRSPHLSPFEDVVLPAVAELSEKKLYDAYLGSHTGCAILPGLALSALGGADMDGDRIFVSVSKDYRNVVSERQRAIKEVFKAQLAEPEKGSLRRKAAYAQMRLPEKEPGEVDGWKILPTVNIIGQTVQGHEVSDVNAKGFIVKAYDDYERALGGQVGQLSNAATAIALKGCGQLKCVNANLPDEEKQKALFSQLELLFQLANYTVAVGLDIDSAKTGYKPRLADYVGNESAPALLQFSQALKKNWSSDAYTKYESALLNAAGDRTKDLLKAKALYQQADEDRRKAEKAVKPENAEVWIKIQNLQKEAKNLKTAACKENSPEDMLMFRYELITYLPENGTSLPEIIVGDKTEQTESEALALSAAKKQINSSKSRAKEICELEKKQQNINTQRLQVFTQLLRQYPRDEAMALMKLLIPNAETKYPALKVNYTEDALPYALKSMGELKEDLREPLFGEADPADFRYDGTALGLLKTLQRWRNNVRRLKKAAEKLDKKVPQGMDAVREALKQIAAENKVAYVDLGKALLNAGTITLKQYVFYGFENPEEMPKPLPQEGQKGGGQND